ncbi:MAG: EAL domain-containing protein [Lentilitoribacter sp.]
MRRLKDLVRAAFKFVASQFVLDTKNKELVKAQFSLFSTQVPLMYAVLLINTWALAFSFYNEAPDWLSVYIPMGITLVCGIRILSWLRSRSADPSFESAHKMLVRTNILSGAFTIMLTVWSLMLYPYGNSFMQGHIAFFMAITGVGVIICLQQLRSAALIIALSVNVPFVLFFGTTGIASFLIIAGNMVLVTAALLMVTTVQSRNFASMIDARVELEAANKENEKLANRDSLTGLANRRQFFTHLNQEFVLAERSKSKLTVGIIDLDGFKPINDLYGHAMGDNLLTQVGARLSELANEHLSISRLGGDEFALVIKNDLTNEQLLAFGREVCDILNTPFALPDASVQISGSIGFAVYPDLASSAHELYERADYALYQSKKTNRGDAVVFCKSHIRDIETDSKIELILSDANLEQEIAVFFQPIVDLKTSRTVAFEALARWDGPILGKVSPAVFIPIAEKTGLITRLTEILLNKALLAASRWPDDIRLSFNLSAKDISSPIAAMKIFKIIKNSQIDPKRIDLEITETATMFDFEQAQSSIQLLKSLGCGIALDDFGTGFSSLSQLHALPLTKIKIDRSFVTQIDQKPASYKIVKSLLALSRDMHLQCVIEGVETKDELKVIDSCGGQFVQGYFFSEPLPETEIAHFIKETVTPHRFAQ